MNLHQLELFVAVAEHGSFTRAAAAMHISQPSVSARIKDLEMSVGQSLFEHIGRRTYLTDAGHDLHDHAVAILQSVAEARRSLQEITSLEKGTLRVVATTTVGSYVLPHVLGRFHRDHPGIALELDVTSWSRSVDLLRRHMMDLAVLGPTDGLGDMVVDNFIKNELVVAAAPNHPLSGRQAIPLTELATYPMLVREQGSGTRADIEKLFAAQGLHPFVTMELRHSTAIKQGVSAGLGISLLPREALGLELRNGSLVALDVQGLPLSHNWHIVHRRERHLPRAARAFKEMLLAFASEHD